MRYLEISDFLAINRMTIYEYELRLKAAELKRLDKSYDIHSQAWANQKSKALNNSGKKSAYKSFKDFFNFEKQENEILGVSKKDTRKKDPKLEALLMKANK